MKNYKKFLDSTKKKEKKSDGGQVKESQQKQYQAKDYFGKGSNGAGEGVANSSGVAMTMNDGGQVQDKDKKQSETDKIGNAIVTNLDPNKTAQFHPFAEGGEVNKSIDDLAKDKLKRYLDLVNQAQENTPKFADGGMVSSSNASANTASSLSPLLKETYAGPEKKKQHLSYGGWTQEQLPKLAKPLHSPAIHAPAEKKYPLSTVAPRISIPKRLKPIGDIKGYAEGTGPEGVQPDDQQDNKMDLGDIPIQTEGLPIDYAREEADAEKTYDNSTEGQIRKEQEDIDNQEAPVEEEKNPNKVDLEGDTLDKNSPEAKEAMAQLDMEDRQKASDKEGDKALEESIGKTPEEPSKEAQPSPQSPKQESFNAMQAMQDATNYRNKAQLWNQLGAIAERGAAAYARIPTTQQETYKENMAIAQQAVDDTKTKIAMQGYDPNSQTSKMFRQYLQKFTGQPVDPNVSAMDGKEILPLAFKDFEAKQAEATRKAMATERAQERLQQTQLITEQRREASKDRAAMLKSSMDQKQQSAQEKKDQQEIDKRDKLAATTGQLLEQMRGSPAAGQAEKDLYNAQKADSLANLYKDPNQMSPQQVRLLATEVSKIASGGAPTMEELKTVDPSSLRRDLAGVIQKFTNSPSPANAADFVKQFKDYTHALSKDSQQVITDRYNRIIEPRKKQLGEEHYNDLKGLYLNRFDNNSTETPSNSQPLAPNEVKRMTKDGRTAIFDGETKKFLRYE